MAMKQVPKMMRAVALSNFCKPAEYDVATLPTPEIANPDEMLIQVRAASVNPIDVKMASGLGKMIEPSSFPYKLGYDLSGIVLAVGSSVTHFKPGDQVYSRIPRDYRGSIAQYAVATEGSAALKPPSLSFLEAASIPLAAQTAFQAFLQADSEIEGGLKGKTVLVPAGLSGTGSFAVQFAKNVFGAGKVITTLSTGKIPMAEEYLGKGTLDQIIDYTKGSVVDAVGKGSVDFLFDTTGQSLSLVSVVKKGGLILSISTVPSGDQYGLKGWLRYALNFVDWVIRSWIGYKGVEYRWFGLNASRESLERLTGLLEEGAFRTVVGEKVMLSDVEGIRRGCGKILAGKGGLGKFVIEIDE